ncbi:MAG: hypothetical protein QXY50_02745 [Candidatus Caldarchaeum sp.]
MRRPTNIEQEELERWIRLQFPRTRFLERESSLGEWRELINHLHNQLF